MCGIFGIYNYKSISTIDSNKFMKSAELMRHRGPNAYGQWGIQNKVELGHLRLSIIDLSQESNQPFFSKCNNYVIIFNGEIYNYLEIKQELLSRGHSFRTSSDTEVLLSSYIEWGPHCVKRFNGDWAFAIYNIQENSLFCSRDRFGVKPFNYSMIDNQFVFSSEIKSILNYYPELRKPNYNVIANYCRNSLGAQIASTWFENIYRLMPAHNMTISDGKVKHERYWNYPKRINKTVKFEDAANIYREIFDNAVRIRMRSDVPVGTTLSSGIDSGSIVSVIRKNIDGEHKTFTAVYQPQEYSTREKTIFAKNIPIDEKTLVEKLSKELHLESHYIDISKTNFCEDLSNVIYFLESGHSSPAIIPLWKIMAYAKKHVTVVMEGQGADELLSGYVVNSFPSLLWQYLKRGNIIQLIKECHIFRKTYSVAFAFKQYIRLLNIDIIERLYQWNSKTNSVFGPKLYNYTRIKDYPDEPKGFDEQFNSELYKSHTGSLVNLLHYGDAISLSCSIESRLPFMDVNLVEYVFQLPFNFKMKNGLGKYIHRISMKDIVPSFIIENQVKYGFNTPLTQHFERNDSDAYKILFSERCLSRGIFDRNGLIVMVDKHVSRNQNYSTILFRLLTVELWFRHYIDSPE